MNKRKCCAANQVAWCFCSFLHGRCGRPVIYACVNGLAIQILISAALASMCKNTMEAVTFVLHLHLHLHCTRDELMSMEFIFPWPSVCNLEFTGNLLSQLWIRFFFKKIIMEPVISRYGSHDRLPECQEALLGKLNFMNHAYCRPISKDWMCSTDRTWHIYSVYRYGCGMLAPHKYCRCTMFWIRMQWICLPSVGHAIRMYESSSSGDEVNGVNDLDNEFNFVQANDQDSHY